MKTKITELLNNLSKVSSVDKIHLTTEQLNSLEALVVAYMSIVKFGLSPETETEMIGMADTLWDNLFIKEQGE